MKLPVLGKDYPKPHLLSHREIDNRVHIVRLVQQLDVANNDECVVLNHVRTYSARHLPSSLS